MFICSVTWFFWTVPGAQRGVGKQGEPGPSARPGAFWEPGQLVVSACHVLAVGVRLRAVRLTAGAPPVKRGVRDKNHGCCLVSASSVFGLVA